MTSGLVFGLLSSASSLGYHRCLIWRQLFRRVNARSQLVPDARRALPGHGRWRGPSSDMKKIKLNQQSRSGKERLLGPGAAWTASAALRPSLAVSSLRGRVRVFSGRTTTIMNITSVHQLKVLKKNVQQTVEAELSATGGLLRLAPC